MRWGLIGASNIAANHMIGAIRGAGGDIRSVLSSSGARAAAYAAEHGIPRGSDDLEALLAADDLEAVYISTTNEKHFVQAMAAIAAGKHVLCEKPLAMTVGDAVTMVRAAQTAGVVFATNHHLRNAGSHLAIRAALQAGRIGDVLSVRVFHAVHLPPFLRGWRIDNPAAGGGVIPDIVVHDADTVRFHLGEDPVEVVAMSGASGMGKGVEDSCMSVWTMPSGAMVMAHESFTHAFAKTGFELHGTKGSIVARNVMTQAPVGEILLRTGSGEEALSFSDHNLYGRAVGLFNDACAGNGRPAADGIDGVKSLAVAAAVADAAATGQRTAVNYGGI
ncbi:Gfo/Idh/MocA family protein [Roseicyclus mahoneyensis]|uniref:1,5-anhydro-D-fructose reductase (1,5-anhydro-D-mannitol-forming) n=1 Tax=Roseicyclus mahoneyensis TaxID=164332 RepID=A0A316GKZ1_9RHOB|nr:Gfo/Idh/MocA family oxidoreductase [Roseicyclus mahoneyensis]PWK61715.1 1,5-anhydro-D-fructose reductase (1,5-anhydro-D-mannitol-forming) [Roseicyclus mahoneyensis]